MTPVAGADIGRAARPARLIVILGCSALLTALLGSWYLTRGEPQLTFPQTWDALRGITSVDDDTAAFVVRELRLPRLILALVAGAALGLSGTIMQDALRNPIADPGLLGISQAASFVVALTLLFPGTLPAVSTPALCLIAGLATGVILVLLARSVRDPVRLILIGFVLAMLYGTLTEVVTLLVPGDGATYLASFYRFDIGSVSGTSWERLDAVWPWLVVAVPLALLCGRTLNLLQLGDDVASSLGMNVTRARLLLLFVAVLLVAPVVAVAGPIAFVALIAPHIARSLLRTTNAFYVLPCSAALGAVVVLAADTAGRLVFFPVEIPAGIWTIVVVGPIAIKLAGSNLRTTGTAAVME